MSVFNSSRLAGKTVLVTGASAGIGASTAELFAKCGSNVVLMARRADKLQAVKAKCEAAHKESGLKEGGKVVVIEADMQKNEHLDAIPGKLEGLEVDILVNNAGMVRGKEQVGADDDINVMFSTNVLGLIHLTQIFVRQFKQRNAGMIINLGSIAGREPYAGGSIYCATKHALAAFTGSLLRELVNTPIRVCEVQPGMVETEFSIVRFRGDKDAADAVYKGIQPLVAQDIAEEIVWCASRPAHVNIAQLCKTTDPQGNVYQTDFLFSRHARQPSHTYSCSPKFLKS
ncbi:malonic semialdehyde reductase [Cryptococcus gattii Ru294]|nr:malonic semialdehyde reductase [Cryptococcus gattii Ru294]